MPAIPPYIVLHKKRGQTPLQAIDAWKAVNSEFASTPATYAGRLDPMAEGKLLILLGEECKRQKAYQGLDKEYEIEVVLDLSTDSGDVLGLAKYDGKDTHPESALVERALKKLSGAHAVPYPAFSSKTVNGKPLFLYKLEGTLDTIVIPEHIEKIYKAKLTSLAQVSVPELQKIVGGYLEDVPRLHAESMAIGRDFRQDEVRARWKEVFDSLPDRTFTVLSLRVTCASGTYMRSLAERLAHELGTAACALSINRTRMGTYRKLGPFGFWTKEF